MAGSSTPIDIRFVFPPPPVPELPAHRLWRENLEQQMLALCLKLDAKLKDHERRIAALETLA